jgi:Carboxypeptidase regulatory-like domain/TonB dependent receptor-like, beta-barrel
MRGPRGVVAFVVGFIVLTFGAFGWAQGNLGSIVGLVTDQTGAAVAGATVTILDVSRGVTRTLMTDSGGQYLATNLIPGQYTVSAQATGFQQFKRENITLLVGQEARVDVHLTLGEQTQTVTVTESVPNIVTTNATLGGVIENQVLDELPVNGRNFLHLLHAVPGVQMKPGGGPNSYVAFGQRNSANTIMVDGLFSVNPNTGNSAMMGGNSGSGGPEQANDLSVDAIQEINVMQNPKAEYGPRPGMYVNTGLKSGTNSLHGIAFAAGRDQALEAKNPFLTTKQPISIIQWGVNLGGPIKKDKLFFFGDYERDDFSVAAPKSTVLPTTAAGLGKGASLPDAIADMNANSIPISQLSLNLAGCTAAGVCDASKGLFGNSASDTKGVVSWPVANVSNNIIGKIDYTPSDKHSIHGEYIFGQGSPTAQNGIRIQPYWRGNYHIRTQLVRATWVYTPTSSWVNEARFGYDRIIRTADPLDCDPSSGAPDYAGTMGFVTGTGLCGFPNLNITGFTGLGSNLGAYNLPRYFHGEDAVTRTFGDHVFKFGTGVRFTNWTGHSTNALRGTIAFTSLENFLAGIPDTKSTANSIQVGSTLQDVAWHSYFVFAQDDWRLTPKITLNLGLRWDYETPMRDANNNMGGFDPSVPSGLFQQTSSRSLWDPPKANWGPRLGIAWDVAGDAKTVVRAGGGVFYNPFIGQLVSTQQKTYAVPTGGTLYLTPGGTTIQGPGDMQNGVITGSSTATLIKNNWAVNTPIFGTVPTTPIVSCGNPSPCSLGTISPTLRMAIVGEWNIGIQRAITNTIALDVNYAGSHGEWGTGALDVNQPTPGVGGSSSELKRRPYYSQFPFFSQILVEGANDPSNYNALQARLTKTTSHGLSFTAGYTWSHTLSIHGQDGTANPKNVMDSTRPYLDYGNSDYDYRHRFTMTGTYLIPGREAPLQLLKGWQLSSSLDILTGLPIKGADTTSDFSGTGEKADKWVISGNPGNFTAGTRTMLPCYGVNGSVFGDTDGCTQVASLTDMPQPCIDLAASLPTNPSVPSSDKNSDGLKALGNYGCYMTGNTVIVPPAQGTYGNMNFNTLRGQLLKVWNLAVVKNFTVKENMSIQFRSEFFNVINVVNYSGQTGSNPAEPSTFGVSSGTPEIISNAPVFGTGGPLKVNFGAKITF